MNEKKDNGIKHHLIHTALVIIAFLIVISFLFFLGSISKYKPTELNYTQKADLLCSNLFKENKTFSVVTEILNNISYITGKNYLSIEEDKIKPDERYVNLILNNFSNLKNFVVCTIPIKVCFAYNPDWCSKTEYTSELINYDIWYLWYFNESEFWKIINQSNQTQYNVEVNFSKFLNKTLKGGKNEI